MKIVSIFAGNLFSFHYNHESKNELRRLLLNWNDVSYLYTFINQNKNDLPLNLSVAELIDQIIDNANDIDDILEKISIDRSKSFDDFFKPLDNNEYRIVNLSKQKGRKNYLRIFAIRIDQNCFVITGGAIKFHHLNKDRPHTQTEMNKINQCQDFLKAKGVYDSDSFYEFITEQI